MNLDSLKKSVQTSQNKAAVFNKIASEFVFNQPDSGIYYAQKALTYIKEENVDKATSLSLIAEASQYKSEYDKSTEYYLKALTISLEQKQFSKAASIYNGIGLNYYYLGDFLSAKNYILKCALLKKELNKNREYAMSLANVIGLYQMLKQYDSAFYYAKISETELRKAKDMATLGNLYNSVGSIYQTGPVNLDSAKHYYNKAVTILSTPELEQYSIGALNNLGQISFTEKKYADSKNYLERALSIADKYKRSDFKFQIYRSLSELYEASGNDQMALEYFRMYSELKDSVLNLQKQETIAQLEAQFQSSEKDKKIKEQELNLLESNLKIEKGKNTNYLIVAISVVLILVLSVVAYVMWLRKKTKELVEEEKTRFFSNVVHEFRTPLTLIKGPLQELKTNPNSEENKHNIDLIERNSNRLLSLVNQLLDVSKVEAGKFILHKNYGNVTLFLDNCINLFRKISLEKGIHLITDIKSDPANYLFSPDAIEKIIANLLSNALKFTSSGGTVSVKAEVGPDKILSIVVSDTGSGISERDLPHVFDRFYQAKQSHETGGTGIGLSLTKELVDLMQGTITVTSNKGKGTSLFVKIPLGAEQAFHEGINEQEGELIVALIEDDKEIADFIGSVLRKEKIAVYNAINGKEGLSLITRLLPDIIITDIMMPVMNGNEMTAKIKSDPLTSHIPVIGLSAKSSQESKLEGLESGIDIYLSKPFAPSELILTIHNLALTLKNNLQKFTQQLKEDDKPFKERIASNDNYIMRLVEIIDANIDDTEFSVNELADKAAISRSQLHRKVKTLSGLSTTHFIRMVKLEKAKDLLNVNSGNVTEVAYMCGFSSQSYFTKSFVEHFGFPPSDLIKNISG